MLTREYARSSDSKRNSQLKFHQFKVPARLSMNHSIDSVPGRIVSKEKKDYLYFGGTAYLGLQGDPEFQELLINNIRRYGTSYGASRISNLQLSIFERVESYLASVSGSPSGLILSSGYLAGQLLTSHLTAAGHSLFSLPGSHGAITPNSNPAVTSIEETLSAIENSYQRSPHPPPVLLLDTIDFAGTHFPTFDCLHQFPLDQMIIVADDSHGLGIVGDHGEGAYQSLQELGCKELIVCGSLSKGFAIDAGIILGSSSRIEQLKLTSLFAGASPPSPASLATLIEAEDLYAKKREQLHKNRNHFLDSVSDNSFFRYNKGHPAFSFTDQKLASRLQEEEGILITHFSYPRPDSTPISRIVISAHHTHQDIRKLSTVVNAHLLNLQLDQNNDSSQP